MKHSSRLFSSLAIVVAAIATMTLAMHAADPAEFKPDATFKGSLLTGWHVLGDAAWKAQNGELIGTAKAGGNGGWLVMDKGLQDLMFFANYRCTGACASGVLMRAQKTADGGLRGVYVSLSEGDLATYTVTLDANGKELTRERLAAAAGRGGAGGGAPRGGAAGGGAAAGATRGGAAGGGAAGAGRGNRGGDPAAANPAPADGAAPAAGAAPARGGGAAAGRAGGGAPAAGGRGGRGAAATLKPGEWNPIDILLSAATVRASLGGGGGLDEMNANGFGPVALFVGGTGEVRYKDVAWKDLASVKLPAEQTSPRFSAIRATTLYYGWSAAASDINHDGVMDVVSGPFYFPGPSFTDQRRYRDGRIYNPAIEYAPDMVNLTADFTGDGWPDILSSDMVGGRPMDLYVNPQGESRRWTKSRVLPTISTEIVVMADLDGDKKPEILFGGGGAYSWAHPDPANPTAVWTSHQVSSQGQPVNIHGLGTGDVNGDKRIDIIVPSGWYEQPTGGIAQTPWTFHPASFGRGGGEIAAYDVNGDGLADVVTSLAAHDWGLAWFEQKKDGTFEEHLIAEDYATSAENAGGVVFSEPHASRFADMNGDGIPDFVVGKRYWSHLENYNGPDPYGPAVVYIYKTVRDPKAPGGAKFVPELVHNRSGIGSSFELMDLNKDGTPDIATSGAYGTFVFLSKTGTARPAPAPAAKK